VYCKAKQARQAGEDKKLFETAVKKFNIHPQKGIDFLISSGYGSSPKDIARFLFVAENLKKDKACILLPPAS
jgi:Sec7-like guanine-nucleotide exchange factor